MLSLAISCINSCSGTALWPHVITGWDFTSNNDKSITRIDWINQQLEQLLHANKHAQKNIKASNSKNRKVVGGKDLLIPVGNLVLLCNHPEGHRSKKNQNNNKDQIYVVTGHHSHRNVYFIKPSKQVNGCKMFDLGITEDQEIEHRKQEEENEEESEDKDLPLYQPAVPWKKDFILHPYNLRPREQKLVNSKTILMSTRL